MDKCAALAHPLPTLGALASTFSPLLQQRFMGKATSPAPAGSRITPSSQEIRLRNTPTNSRGDPTRECEKQQALHGKPRIVGHYLIHLLLLADSLLEEYAHGWEHHLASKLFEFHKRRRETADDIRNRRETGNARYYTEYGQLTQTRSDNANTIRQRHAFFAEEMLKLLSPTKLDPVRSFSDLERKTVFFRDMEICQWCRMKENSRRVSWDECEIHHITPHAHGGSTDIENAALVHRDCHPKSRADVDEFREWWYGSPGSEGVQPPESGHDFPPPEGTKAKFEYLGQEHMGEIRDGKLLLSGSRDGATYKSFSGASCDITGTSRNGWRDWQLNLPGDDTWILADEWRRRS